MSNIRAKNLDAEGDCNNERLTMSLIMMSNVGGAVLLGDDWVTRL